jgi:hypothetical protein
VTRAVASVIIPAHNEERVIARTLEALTAGGMPLQIVVACNGCTDRTADVVRTFSSHETIEVVETAEASKAAALRAAEGLSPVFPRMYVDADVIVSADAVVAVAEELARSQALAGRPAMRYDTTDGSLLVRAFYRARSRTPELMSSLWGAGYYGVTQRGRSRWGEFPEIAADDLFFDSLFGPDEIVVVATEPVVVRTPKRVGPLLRTLARVYAPAQRTASDAEAAATKGTVNTDLRGATSPASSLRALVRSNVDSPGHVLDLIAYVILAVGARLLIRLQPEQHRWQRDDSSREC